MSGRFGVGGTSGASGACCGALLVQYGAYLQCLDVAEVPQRDGSALSPASADSATTSGSLDNRITLTCNPVHM